MKIVIITGMSGAGKSRVIDAMEDIGYYCIDNVPSELIDTFVMLLKESGKHEKVAVVSDARSGNPYNNLKEAFATLKDNEIPFSVMFLDASNDVLRRRFKETRRKHPLLDEMQGILPEAIERERIMITPIREQSDYIIDTSDMSPAQLKDRVNELFLENNSRGISIHCMSFGTKYGSVSYADLCFDVRCLPNPFYVPELRPKTGLDKEVRDYVMGNDVAVQLKTKLFDLIDFLLPLYIEEGKCQLVIAFSCTGGQHRSVTFAELTHDHLVEMGYNVSINHRDVGNAK